MTHFVTLMPKSHNLRKKERCMLSLLRSLANNAYANRCICRQTTYEEKRTRKVKDEGMQAMGMNYERGYRTNCFSNSVMDFSFLVVNKFIKYIQ